MSGAWANQAKSLVEVQKFGGDLEKKVSETLGWPGGRVVYDKERGYSVQADSVYPSAATPTTIVSVTYSNPDTPGHSNENKLQLKLGELALLKFAYPDVSAVLVLGGTRESWLPYVLEAFKYFFDDVIALWDVNDAKKLIKLSKEPTSIKPKHQNFWKDLRAAWAKRKFSAQGAKIPNGLVRYSILDTLKLSAGAAKAQLIKNEIARHCMESSFQNEGTEWKNFLAGHWTAIEMSRSFFNPVEAIVDLSLKLGCFKYEGGLARDVEIPSLLHQLGMNKTKLSEDFILYSEKLGAQVYIQCKASGGGRSQHGKNIQNRTKEQVARGILYTARISKNGELQFRDKTFHWVGVVDGNWGVTKRQALKYIHMLELAGYDKIFCAADLLDGTLSLHRKKNILVDYLKNDLDCLTIS